MRRWLVLLTLIALLPWQSAAWAMTALADDGHHAEHAIAHWSGAAHHHHDEGDGLHKDDSNESIAHVVQTSAHANAPAVLPAVVAYTPAPADAAVPDGTNAPAHPSPCLEGLRRPPRSAG
jgi:hypothetical protein